MPGQRDDGSAGHPGEPALSHPARNQSPVGLHTYA
jgi:hypothetical protein